MTKNETRGRNCYHPSRRIFFEEGYLDFNLKLTIVDWFVVAQWSTVKQYARETHALSCCSRFCLKSKIVNLKSKILHCLASPFPSLSYSSFLRNSIGIRRESRLYESHGGME